MCKNPGDKALTFSFVHWGGNTVTIIYCPPSIPCRSPWPPLRGSERADGNYGTASACRGQVLRNERNGTDYFHQLSGVCAFAFRTFLSNYVITPPVVPPFFASPSRALCNLSLPLSTISASHSRSQDDTLILSCRWFRTRESSFTVTIGIVR